MSENLSRKERDEKVITERYIYTAFFYSEYILRNYEINHHYLIEYVNIILEFIERKYNCTQKTAINILDRLIEMKSGTDDIDFYCSISKNAILKRFIKECQNLDLTPSDFYNLYEDLLFNDLEEYLHELIHASLNEGVYLSHLTTYRSIVYNFDIFKHENYNTLTKHIFFKKDFLICREEPYISLYNNKKIDLDTYIDNLHNVEDQPEELVLELTILPTHKSFSIKNVLKHINSILLAQLHTDIRDALKDNTASSSEFMNNFFKKTILRPTESELQNRLLGLLIWDIHFFEKIEKSPFSIYSKEFLKRYNFLYRTYDDTYCYGNCEACTSNECRKNISILMNHTKKSIDKKEIYTR